MKDSSGWRVAPGEGRRSNNDARARDPASTSRAADLTARQVSIPRSPCLRQRRIIGGDAKAELQEKQADSRELAAAFPDTIQAIRL